MHRSGTSAITRGLQVLGVSLGDNLMPAAENNNEKGFFEDLDIHALNTQLLSALGLTWDQVCPIRIDNNAQVALLDTYAQQAIELLSVKMSSSTIFAFKDPQTSLLLPFWQAIFKQMAIETNYIICLRNPLSVAASLHKRDGVLAAKAQLLWAKYLEAALSYTAGSVRIVVDYDALMEQPSDQLKRIADALHLPSPDSNPDALDDFCQEFLTTSLRHTQYNIGQLEDTSEVLRQLHDLHALLLQCANDELDVQATDFTQRCKPLLNGLDELLPLAREIDHLNASQAHLKLEVEELDRKVSNIEVLQDERDQLRTKLAITQAECTNAWQMHDQALEARQGLATEYLASLQNAQNLHAEIERLHASLSWRLTRPLRGFRRHYRSPHILLRALISETSRALWQSIPGSTADKQKLKGKVFSFTGPLLQHTKAYQDWQRMISDAPASQVYAATKPQKALQEPIQHVKKIHGEPRHEPPAKLISFYLPQFHPIAENNEWWGDGFTEWTNVKPAQPQYVGHYQPHVPGDLGYYDLEDIETQRKQVELAKRYGIGGFCFYFYWFDGKRLLENPIKQYLENPELDLPFCLCWANENWSRRWDGLDSHVLIGQNHSPEDDLAFIEHIAQYMKDSRYIRIEGKPLLVIYRPSLLPDPKATAGRWRKWCLENGVGEIYLAYTQSFEIAPPAKYGCDAAIEFPPNTTQPPVVGVEPLDAAFSGNVFDWSVYLQRSAQYSAPTYKLFRGVCPSWDNTARRKTRSTSFINSSPRGYQEWLFNAVMETVRQQKVKDERLVFINAWNEWAEGAHLEPDERYGYGFLEATRMANTRAALQLEKPKRVSAGKEIAVVIHAYYPQVFAEIINYLNQVDSIPLKLYISTEQGRGLAIRKHLVNCPHPHILTEMTNHGRDVLPFLKLLPHVIADGHEHLIKVHTKKSTHREDGDIWRKDLYEKLLTQGSIESAIEQFSANAGVGIIGPEGHIVPMSFYWGSNAATVEKLSCRLGIKPTRLAKLNFVAGTMFFASVKALQPLLDLALDDADFEVETGQVDGTFAHAIERVLSISAHSAGLTVSPANNTEVALAYPFAKAYK